MAKSAIEISVVIPVFQEHAVIALTLAAVADVLNTLSVTYEIVVVDDGSTDDTFERCAQFRQQNPCIKIVGLSRRFGKEAALVAGMARASGDAIMTLDGDMQHPPVKIPEFIQCWRDGAQVVHGVKVNRYFEGFFHQIAARGFNWVMSRTAGFDMAGSSDYKLFDRVVANTLIERFPEHHRFHRGLSVWVGFSQATVPFSVGERPAGWSRWRVRDLARYGWNTLTAYTSLPLQIVPLLGAVMLVVSMLLGIEAALSRWRGESVSGFATLEMTILFTGSMIMIGLGVLGQYLARVYDELKQRPLYLVGRELGFEPTRDSFRK